MFCASSPPHARFRFSSVFPSHPPTNPLRLSQHHHHQTAIVLSSPPLSSLLFFCHVLFFSAFFFLLFSYIYVSKNTNTNLSAPHHHQPPPPIFRERAVAPVVAMPGKDQRLRHSPREVYVLVFDFISVPFPFYLPGLWSRQEFWRARPRPHPRPKRLLRWSWKPRPSFLSFFIIHSYCIITASISIVRNNYLNEFLLYERRNSVNVFRFFFFK